MIPSSDQHIRRKLTDIEERVNAQDFKKAFKLINGFVQKSKDITETCIFLAMKCSILINYNSPQQLKQCKDELKKRIIEQLTSFSPLLFQTMHNVWYQMQESQEFIKIVQALFNKNQKDSKCASFLMDLYFQKMDFLSMNKLVKGMEKAFPDPKYKVFSAFLMYMNAQFYSPQAIGLAKLSMAPIFMKYDANHSDNPDFYPPIGQIQLYSRILSKSGDWKGASALLSKNSDHLETKEANYALKLQISIFLKHDLLLKAYNTCVKILQSNFQDKIEADFQLIFKYIELSFSLLLKIFDAKKNFAKYIPASVAQFINSLADVSQDCTFQELRQQDMKFIETYQSILQQLKKFSNHSPQKGSLTYKLNIRKSAALGYIYGIHKLMSIQIQNGDESHKSALNPLFQPLCSYIVENFDTPSLLIDVQPYLHYLQEEERQKLLTTLKSKVEKQKQEMEIKIAEKAEESKEQNTFSVEIKYLRIYINLQRIEKILGKWTVLNPSQINEMLSLYRDSLTYQGVLKKGQHRVGDELILLIVESLSLSTNSTTGLLNANTFAAILGAVGAIKHTPHNYFIKVQLLRILAQYGFHDLFQELFLKLEVKAVLHESLGYLGQIPFFLNLGYDRFQVGLQKLRKYHLKSAADLRIIKNQSLDERSFGAIQHFIEFEAFNKKSYFYLLSTFIQKCCSFQKAMEKHTKAQRIHNIEQVQNFTAQGAQEMAQFFKENNNTVFRNRTQDLNLTLPKNQYSIPIKKLFKETQDMTSFFEDADEEFKTITRDDILFQSYKTHPKTNYRPGKVNVLNIFETTASLQFLMKFFSLLHSAQQNAVSEQSKQSQPNETFKKVSEELESLLSQVEEHRKEPENRSVEAEFRWFISFGSFCLTSARYIKFLEHLSSLKLGMMNPDQYSSKHETHQNTFKERSVELEKQFGLFLESTSIQAPPAIQRKTFLSQLQEFKWQSPEKEEDLLKGIMTLTPPLLRRTTLFISIGLTYIQFLLTRISKLSSSAIGKRKKVKNKTEAHLNKESQLKELEGMLKDFKLNLLSRLVAFLKHTIEQCLSEEYLNRLSDMYVEYLLFMRTNHPQTQEVWKFIELGCSKSNIEDIERECNELARGFVHSWKRTKSGLEANLKSIEAKLGD